MADHHHQETDVSCGGAARRMALGRLGVPQSSDQAVIDVLGTEQHGTHVDRIVAAVARRGREHLARHGAVEIADLQTPLEDHIVLACYQWKRLRAGHFSVLDAPGDVPGRVAIRTARVPATPALDAGHPAAFPLNAVHRMTARSVL